MASTRNPGQLLLFGPFHRTWNHNSRGNDDDVGLEMHIINIQHSYYESSFYVDAVWLYDTPLRWHSIELKTENWRMSFCLNTHFDLITLLHPITVYCLCKRFVFNRGETLTVNFIWWPRICAAYISFVRQGIIHWIHSQLQRVNCHLTLSRWWK